MSYYYWDDKHEPNLAECIEKYGIGSQKLNKHIYMDVIFLDRK